MTKIYSYILRIDDGAAPNPFGDLCTLAICKPAIRRTASIGDWVIGTGSKNTKLSDRKTYDFSNSIVYAMKITDVKTLKEYDDFCKKSLKCKLPNWQSKDWKKRIGDCIYNYEVVGEPQMRNGVHNEGSRITDLGGHNALMSDHFYYFGVEARPLPANFKDLIKKNQGHKKVERLDLISEFEGWISQFQKNKLYADPQMKWIFEDDASESNISACSKEKLEDDKDESEEPVC
ncbi:hypothetical protein G3O08_14080 [Cryomorpha ignava]|uniref:Nucleotide modification associated domain-containing protein n=1 Tax=Cryomorpha ignava TaxID=101383 RepID=A0A7K3WUB6_9FLAO|nr:hypothetical protein [Cryomorpha ignava]NEN24631.1 hypothetical protein [Cryomorpha ignava]